MNKYEMWYNWKRRGYIWALDQEDARHRFASRHCVDVASVKAFAVISD